jgi:hypothetical protein
MKADQIEVRSEALTIFEFVQDMGPRRARKLASKIPYNHPLRGEARELAQKHWEDIAILLLEKQKRDTGRKVDQGAIVSKAQAAREQDALTVWKRGGTSSLAKVIETFDRVNPAARFELCTSATGAPKTWEIGTAKKNAEYASKAIESGRAVAGLRPKAGYCILSVSEKAAAKFAKAHDVPTTVCWTCDGWQNWLLRGSPVTAPVHGESVRVIVSAGRDFTVDNGNLTREDFNMLVGRKYNRLKKASKA